MAKVVVELVDVVEFELAVVELVAAVEVLVVEFVDVAVVVLEVVMVVDVMKAVVVDSVELPDVTVEPFVELEEREVVIVPVVLEVIFGVVELVIVDVLNIAVDVRFENALVVRVTEVELLVVELSDVAVL
jgi:hypothetical protein